jgi:glutamate-ammonia-ligase adenylyltransferase
LPQITALLEAGDGEGALAAAAGRGGRAGCFGCAAAASAGHGAGLGIGDLAGAFPLAKVTGDLSALADASLDAAMAHAITTRVPDAQPAGFWRWRWASMAPAS